MDYISCAESLSVSSSLRPHGLANLNDLLLEHLCHSLNVRHVERPQHLMSVLINFIYVWIV